MGGSSSVDPEQKGECVSDRNKCYNSYTIYLILVWKIIQWQKWIKSVKQEYWGRYGGLKCNIMGREDQREG